MALRELGDLRQDAAEMCADLARIELAFARGTPFPRTLPQVVSAHRLACSRDGLAQAREALAAASGAGRVARLASLRDFLVRARALELEPGAAQEALELPRRPSVRLSGDPGLHGALPPVAVERDLPFVREREERAGMESALAAAERSAGGVRTALWEAAQEALSELERGEPAEAAVALHERGWAPLRRAEPSEPPPPAAPPVPVAGSSLLRPAAPPAPEQDALTAACEKFLRDTDALARDLGAWLLERHTGARAAPGGAERHDLLNFFHAPRFAGAFPRGELLRTVRRWAAMPGLDLSAGGTISLEEEERPLQPAGSRAVAVDPPHEVRVVLRPAEGPRALAGLLGAIGRAQLRAGPPPDAPPEDLWLGDAGLTPACGAPVRRPTRRPRTCGSATRGLRPPAARSSRGSCSTGPGCAAARGPICRATTSGRWGSPRSSMRGSTRPARWPLWRRCGTGSVPAPSRPAGSCMSAPR